MNCQYCQKPISQIAKGAGNEGVSIHYHCSPCKVYYHYIEPVAGEEMYLYKITLWDIQTPRREFFIEMYPQNKHTVVYVNDLVRSATLPKSFSSARISYVAFELNSIPNWTPADVAQRLNNLLPWI